MIRNLKVLIAAAMALAAFGALSATAHAAEEKFHCSVEPNCQLTLAPDGTAGETTAHQVFVVKGETNAGVKGASVSFTCDQLTGEATVATKTDTVATFTNLKYENAAGEDKCKIGASETVTVDFTTCNYKFTSTGGSTSIGNVQVLCTSEPDAIDINIKGTTCLKVNPFVSQTAGGLGYHDAGFTKEVLTATANVTLPVAKVELVNIGNANCAALNLKKVEEARYTTGNTLVKAEKEGVKANVWFE
jgi:hypothetical protein